MHDQSITFEQWLPVVGFERFYEVSDRGRIRSILTRPGTRVGKILRPTLSKGYFDVHLQAEGRHWRGAVHNVVAAAFIGPKPEAYQVNHKNGIKIDNRVENLEYVSRSENVKHAFRLKLNSTAGRKNGRLTDLQVSAVRWLADKYTPVQIAQLLNIHRTTIDHIIKGRTWKGIA